MIEAVSGPPTTSFPVWRRRAGWVVALVVGLVAASAGTIGSLGAAQADPSSPGLGAYSMIGRASGFSASEDEPSANAHPEGEGTVPLSESLLANGTLDYGLSSVAWPGATEANAGTLAPILFPGPLGALPVPFPDAITQAVDQNASVANYPVRAEARSGTTPDSTFSAPGVLLEAHADASRVEGSAVMQSASEAGVMSFGDMATDSTSTLTGGALGRVEARAQVHDVNLAGGVVHIDSVVTDAIATTTGTKITTTGSTAVTGMTVGGMPAYIDQHGVHSGSPGQPVNHTADSAFNQALAGAGMKVYVSEPQSVISKGMGTYTAGSVVFTWTPPDDPSANVFTVSLGGASVTAAGIPGEPSGLGAPGSASPAALTSAGSGSAALPGTTAGVSGSSGSLTTSPNMANPTATPGSAMAEPSLSERPAVSTSVSGIPFGWILLALAGVALLFVASRKLAHDLLDRPRVTCPLEAFR